jgi:transcriptional regulator with XRE-family HTH domain
MTRNWKQHEIGSVTVNITSEQCRAARALLNWPQLELAKRSKVSNKTVADFENGIRRPYAATLTVLRLTLEAGGVEFTGAIEDVCGAGVRFKWGAEPGKTDATQGNAATGQGDDKGGLDALGWDWDDESVEDDEPLPPLDWTDEDRANQIEYWRARPERWAAFHEVSRQCLLRAMGVERL